MVASFNGARLETEDGWVFSFRPFERIDLEENWWVVEGQVDEYNSQGELLFILRPHGYRKMECVNFIVNPETGALALDVFIMQR